MDVSEAELQAYLREHNIETVLKEMVVNLFAARPEKPLEFMKNYLEQQMSGQDDAGDSGDGGEEEDPAAMSRQRTRRAAISASVMTADDVKDYEKKVVPKDAATMKQLQKAVSENVLFQHLDSEELNEVLDAMFLAKYTPGEFIIKQGDEGDNFYVIDNGNVEVWKQDEGESEAKKVLELGPGGSFGELALIYNQPRAASVKAVDDVTLWAIDQDTYRRILMGSTIRKRKMYEEFLEQVDILSSLDRYERLQVADALSSCSYEDGDDIVKQGEEGDEFYIILEGNAVVTQTNDAGETGPVGELKKADYFGEIALLKDNVRHATVTAKGPVKCVKLDRDTFERVLGPIEDILRRNMEKYQQYTSS